MPSLSITAQHNLGQAEALTRLQGYLAKLKQRYQDKFSNLTEQWLDNRLKTSFSAYGFNVQADMAVEPNEVKLSAAIPFAAMLFKGKIEQTIRDELARVLA